MSGNRQQHSGNSGTAGGIAAQNISSLEIINSTIAQNETVGDFSPGGGVSLNTGTLNVIQSTLSGNRTIGADSHGGGISAELGSLRLVQSTVTANVVGQTSSATGGGVYCTSHTVSVHNTIIAGNVDASSVTGSATGSAPDLSLISSHAGPGSVRSSLIGRSNGSGLTTTTGTSPEQSGKFCWRIDSSDGFGRAAEPTAFEWWPHAHSCAGETALSSTAAVQFWL
ncbi:MAG UNVERIFIED_CONTAM: hypothetical protein LVR18_23650 [Planctomycetaceae bacterium]|jgi:hypothetical protein